MESVQAHGVHAHSASSPAVAAMPAGGHAGSHGGALFAWRPTVDTEDCRFRGLTAHALLLGALAMFLLPHSVAHANRRRIQGTAALMFLGACVSNAVQRTCRAPKALADGNMHAVLGWCFVTAVAAISVALPQLTQPGGAGERAMLVIGAAISRASAVVLGAPMQLRSWVLTAALVLGVLLLLTGVWSTLNCYDSPGFIGYEIGHLIPASMWIGTGAAALCFRRPAAQFDLQRMEGRLMLLLGGLFLTEITMAHHGGMFGPTGGYVAFMVVTHFFHLSRLCSRRTHHDQQHQSSGLLYVASGALALALAHQGVATGVHMLLPAIGQGISASPLPRLCRMAADALSQ